jgi:hypothetical protein
VLVDHDLSKEIKHIGSMEFTHDHAEACRSDIADDIAAAAARIEGIADNIAAAAARIEGETE